MAAQFLPIVKAIAPYIAQVATVAIPAFTSKQGGSDPDVIKSDPVIVKQIGELQSAASQNAQSVKVLAEKLQQAIEDIERSAQSVSKKIAAYKLIIFASISLSIISLALCIYVLISDV
ncbi:MAG: hypothetical protein WBM38_03750 [Arenicellales bacterium]